MPVLAPPQAEVLPDASLPPASKVQLVSATLVVALPLVAVVLAVVIFWQHGIGWLDLGLAAGMYIVTGLGLSLGFHRLFSHRSFVPARWLKVTLAIAGTMGIEGSLSSWVSQHRRHHAFTDRPGDPHSPVPEGPGLANTLRGLWHAHAGWLFVPNEVNAERWSSDLQEDPDLAFVSRTVVLWTVLSFLIPMAIGWIVIGTALGSPAGRAVGWRRAGRPPPPRDLGHQLALPHVRQAALRRQGPQHQLRPPGPPQLRRCLAQRPSRLSPIGSSRGGGRAG